MRGSCPLLLLGIAVGCSGERFVMGVDSAGSAGVSVSESSGSGPSSGGPSIGGVPGSVFPGLAGGGVGAGGALPSSDRPQPAGSGGVDVSGGGGAIVPAGGMGGEGGASPSGACPSGESPDWELGYFPELREASTVEIHPFFQITHRGASTRLDRIAVRYYFTQESDVPETATCYWVSGDRCALAQMEFADLPSPTSNASRYLEVRFPEGSNVMVLAEDFEVRVGFKSGSTVSSQTNDYSFDPAANGPTDSAPFPYKRWPDATLYVDGQLVWGTEPCER